MSSFTQSQPFPGCTGERYNIVQTVMAHLTPHAWELLQRALALSSHERGLLIDHLIESLDQAPPDSQAEQLWSEEIKKRVEDVRSGKVEMISGEEVRRRLGRRLLHGRE